MILNLTDLSDEPLQSQIARQIRAKILSGDLAAWEALPSIRVLAREHHISVVTAQRGYESLERESLIHSRRGKGFFVSKIKRKDKKEMAKKKLSENAGPILKRAKEEGLGSEEIMRTLEKIIKKGET